MKWAVKWLPEAVEDLEKLDKGIRLKVLKAVAKLETNPLEYGKPLGEKTGIDLSGLRKLTPVRGYRIVYQVEKENIFVAVIAVGKREGLGVYKTAAKRIAEYREMTGKELELISKLLTRL